MVSGSGTASVSARAIDDSANIGTAPAVRSLTLTGAESLFGALVPKIPATDDTTSVEVGVKVKPTVNGQVTGIRFYKGTGNTGTHTGTLWSAGGAVLATGTFSGESASGWQSLTFSTPGQRGRRARPTSPRTERRTVTTRPTPGCSATATGWPDR